MNNSPRAARWRRRITVAVSLIFAIIAVASATKTTPLEPHPQLEERVPVNIAHAGAQGHAPENTLEAFEIALEMGADALEMDLQITADDEVVVHHDGTVDRQTDASGAIRNMTLAELEQLDAGYAWQGQDGEHRWRGEGIRIPTLEKVFETFPDALMVLELKTEGGPEIVANVAERIDDHDRAPNDAS